MNRVVFHCPICRVRRVASEQIIGRRVRCADCENFVEVTVDLTEPLPEGHLDELQETDMSDQPPEDDFDLTPPVDPEGMSELEPGDGAEPDAKEPADAPGDEAAGDADSPSSEPKPDSIVRWKEEPDESDEKLADVQFGAGRDRGPIELDMTPMVDVTFLLLIFFMVTASFTLLKTIEQPPPNSEDPSETYEEEEDNPDYILVFIDEFNTYQVIYSDLEAEAPSEQELYVRLREAMNVGPIKPTKLMIKAHGDCSHSRVVTAMDAGTDVGLAEVDVMLTEQDAL